MALVITMDLSRPTNQLGNYAAPFLVLGQTKAAPPSTPIQRRKKAHTSLGSLATN
jgi:hypothetical protein